MTLADLMRAIALMAPFFTCLAVGADKGRSVGLLLGLIVGVVVSVVSFRGFIVVQNWGFGRLGRHTETSFTFALAWLWLLVLSVWIVGFSFFGARLMEFVVHRFIAKA